MAKSLLMQYISLCQYFVMAQRGARGCIVHIEPAIGAGVDAFIGNVQGRVQPHDFAEAQGGDPAGARGQGFNEISSGRGNQHGEILGRAVLFVQNPFNVRKGCGIDVALETLEVDSVQMSFKHVQSCYLYGGC